ncbi:MAG TPA: hypothetical protein VMT52_13510 [Planctomycetota bacterium]|nr:hypothetical protein [Planctomycetota bacterium]
MPRTILLSPLEPPLDRFHAGKTAEVLDIIAAEGFFAPRDAAEGDPSLKQVIPYAIVVHGDQVLLLKRSKKGGEARLHEMFSLGVGGHVNPEDGEGGGVRDAVHRAFDRELREEIVLTGTPEREALGVVNDDSNAVGRVHIGLVYRLELREAHLEVREDDLLSGGFVPSRTLSSFQGSLESWSRLIVEHFGPGIAPSCNGGRHDGQHGGDSA